MKKSGRNPGLLMSVKKKRLPDPDSLFWFIP